jgi:hypothetical protein
MRRPADFMRAILKGVIAIGILASVLVALLIAWWLAALAITGWLIYAGVRKLFSGKKPDPSEAPQPLIIEGEYRVEPEALPDSRRDADGNTRRNKH